MTSRSRIALAVAGLFLGAQIGMAALSELQETAAAEGAEQETVAESTAPELSVAEAPAESETASPEAQPEVSIEHTVEIPQRNLAAEALAEARFVEYVVPSSAHEYPPMLPATIAYLESRNTTHLVAAPIDEVIPVAYDPAPLLPATLAYLERKEAAARFAASDTTVVAAAPAAQ